MIIDGVKYSWTQATCENCWEQRNPGRGAIAMTAQYRETEKCCYCGVSTRSGIYTRVDPTSVPYPSPEQ